MIDRIFIVRFGGVEHGFTLLFFIKDVNVFNNIAIFVITFVPCERYTYEELRGLRG